MSGEEVGFQLGYLVRLEKEYFLNPPKQRVQLSTNKIVTVTSNDCLIFLLASYLTLLPLQT